MREASHELRPRVNVEQAVKWKRDEVNPRHFGANECVRGRTLAGHGAARLRRRFFEQPRQHRLRRLHRVHPRAGRGVTQTQTAGASPQFH